MQIQLLRGDQNNPLGNTPFTARGGRNGDLVVSELHGRYYHTTEDGRMFVAATQALVTTTVGLATTYTGLCLSNPIGSGTNLVVDKCTMMQSVIQSVQPEAFAIAVGYSNTTNVVHTTPVAPRNNLIGVGASGVGLADVSATLPVAPTYHSFVGNTPSATTNIPGGFIDFEGSLILPPGAFACWVTPAQASVAGMWFSFSYEETPA